MMSTIKDLIHSRRIILQLACNDFRNKFAGSYLGIFWAFAQPIVNVTVYWFIFSQGLKTGPEGDYPFLLWLVSGICPWFFLNDALNSATNSLVEYGYIVKKVKFNISIIPMIKIMSSLFVHMFFIVVVAAVFLIHRYSLTIYVVQCLYYSFCTLVFIIGIVYFTSAIHVFFRDMGQIVSIIMQYSMWTVPIMIADQNFPKIMIPWLKYNPLYYLIQGYRDCFIDKVWFWERPKMTFYYWSVILIVLLVGRVVYRRLKPHFADVL